MTAAPSCGPQVAYSRCDSPSSGTGPHHVAHRAAAAASRPTDASPWPSGISPTREYQAAYDFLKEGDGHLFVTGRAGTGKSTLLTCLKELLADEMVILAPTGLAAVNVGGQTIHSFFGFPPRLIRPDDIRRSRNGRLMRRLEVPRHRRGVDGALRSDVGHRPVAAPQPRPAARGLRRRAPGLVRRPAPAAARRQRCGGGRAPGIAVRRPLLLQPGRARRGGRHVADRARAGVPAEGRRTARRAQQDPRGRGGRGGPRPPQQPRAPDPHACPTASLT